MQRQRPKPPKLQTSTLWYYPTQQHTDVPLGDPRYEGRTPTYVLWNLLERYTREGDRVLDPFCGGGTTIDVAKSLGREGIGFDVQPHRNDIGYADARSLPLEDESVDFVFCDPPYSTHLVYSGRDECLGELSAFDDDYFEAYDEVFAEIGRVLRDRRYLAVYTSDTYKKKQGFVGIGARFFELLSRRYRPIDHVAVVRGNRKLEKPGFHRAAAGRQLLSARVPAPPDLQEGARRLAREAAVSRSSLRPRCRSRSCGDR